MFIIDALFVGTAIVISFAGVAGLIYIAFFGENK